MLYSIKKGNKGQISVGLAIALLIIMGSMYYITSEKEDLSKDVNLRFIGDKNTKVVYDKEVITPSCDFNKIPPENRVYFNRMDVAVSMDYTSCYG